MAFARVTGWARVGVRSGVFAFGHGLSSYVLRLGMSCLSNCANRITGEEPVKTRSRAKQVCQTFETELDRLAIDYSITALAVHYVVPPGLVPYYVLWTI